MPTPETSELLHPKKHKWIGAAVAAIVLAVFALYVHTLSRQSLWLDEGISVLFAGRPLPQLLHTLIYEDLHPPLYYLLLHYWMALAGDSEWAVRMPSAFAAVLLMPLAFAVVGEVWDHQQKSTWAAVIAGAAAAALVGASPFIAFYAQETRMYSLAAALSLAATWAFLKAMRSAARIWWLAFSFLLAASLYTQYLSVFIVPAFLVYTLLFDRRSLLHAILSTALAALLYLPWIHPAYVQLGRLLRAPDYWVTTRINPGLFLRALWAAFLPNAAMRWGLLIVGLGILLLLGLAWRSGLKLSERGRRSALVFLTFAIPLALNYLTVTLAPKFATRYTIVTAAPLYICIVLALYALLGNRPSTRVLFGLLIAVAVAISLRSTVAVVEGRENLRDDARGLAAYLSANAQSSDALLLVENAPHALRYYYRGQAQWYGVHVGQDFSGAAGVLNSMLQARPRRIWLILWHNEFADPTDMVITELSRVGREVDVPQQFFGYQLLAFDLQDYQQPIAAYPPPQTVTNADFGPGLRLLGFDRFSHDAARIHYVLYWEAQRPLARNYSLTLRLQDHEGNEYLRQDQALCTPYFLPPVWPLQTPIRGHLDVSLAADLPPLPYRVSLQVFDPASQSNLDLIDVRGAPLGQTLFMEDLVLRKTDVGENPSEVKYSLQADMGDGLVLLGFDVLGTEYRPGDDLPLTLWWQGSGMSREDVPVQFRLLDGKHSAAWQDQRPIVPDHPITQWQAGEVNRVVYRLSIPPDFAEGDYGLQAGIAERQVSLTMLHIASREHSYDVPAMQQSLGAQFEKGIALLGYELQAPALQSGKSITVTLYWQTQQRVAASYKVSVQVLSADAVIMAQEDSVPVRWTYPTTAWLPGEIITDEHVVTIKPGLGPGDYSLIVALYDEQSAERLHTQQGGQDRDHAILTTVPMTP